MTSAVVGASVAGLLSACGLADLVDEVVVLERERLPAGAVARGHVPQGRHLHLLLSGGLRLLDEWFPSVQEELVELGAVRVDGTQAWDYQSGGYRVRGDWGRPVISMTRPLLERVLRRRVEALDNVTVEEGVLVESVAVSDGRVSGVVIAGGSRPLTSLSTARAVGSSRDPSTTWTGPSSSAARHRRRRSVPARPSRSRETGG